MNKAERRADTARIVGTLSILAGLLITGVGLSSDAIPAKGYFLAGMLVVIGAGLRLEAAVTRRP